MDQIDIEPTRLTEDEELTAIAVEELLENGGKASGTTNCGGTFGTLSCPASIGTAFSFT